MPENSQSTVALIARDHLKKGADLCHLYLHEYAVSTAGLAPAGVNMLFSVHTEHETVDRLGRCLGEQYIFRCLDDASREWQRLKRGLSLKGWRPVASTQAAFLLKGARSVYEFEMAARGQARLLVERHSQWFMSQPLMRQTVALIQKEVRVSESLRGPTWLVLADLAIGLADYVDEALDLYNHREVPAHVHLLSENLRRSIGESGPLDPVTFVHTLLCLA